MSGISNLYQLNNATYSNGEYWLAESSYGLIRLGTNGDDYFHTDGPNSNFGYCMYAAHDQIYSAIGGRWAEQFLRYGRINIYDRNNWRCINEGNIGASVGRPAIDIVSLAIDPNDAGHWFALRTVLVCLSSKTIRLSRNMMAITAPCDASTIR